MKVRITFLLFITLFNLFVGFHNKIQKKIRTPKSKTRRKRKTSLKHQKTRQLKRGKRKLGLMSSLGSWGLVLGLFGSVLAAPYLLKKKKEITREGGGQLKHGFLDFFSFLNYPLFMYQKKKYIF